MRVQEQGPIHSTHKSQSILPIQQLIKIACAINMHNIIKMNSHKSNTKFAINNTIHYHNTRAAQKIHPIIQTKTTEYETNALMTQSITSNIKLNT